MDASIFISFATEDRKVASTLCKALESRGFKCWFSSRDIAPGENFQVAIVRAIRRAKVLLLVFTENSNHSEEMTKELALASQERLIVVPLRVEDVAPSEAFAYEFATRQWIDFFADWEAAIDQLSERLSQALPAPVAAAAGGGDVATLPPPEAPAAREKPRREPKPAAAPEPEPVVEAAPAPEPEPEPEPVLEADDGEIDFGTDEIEIERDTIAPEQPILLEPEAGDAELAPAPRRKLGVWIAAGAAVAALAAAAVLGSGLLTKKPAPKAVVTPSVVAAPTGPAPVDAVPLDPNAPLAPADPAAAAAAGADPAAVGATAGDPTATGAAPTLAPKSTAKPARPKQKSAPQKRQVEEIPY